MSFYSDLAVTARTLLTEFGQNVTFVRRNLGVHDPVTGITAGAGNLIFTGYAAIFDYETKLIDGTNIQVGDKNVTLEAGNEPQIDDVMTVGDGDYTVLNVSPLSPAGEVVIYELHVRS